MYHSTNLQSIYIDTTYPILAHMQHIHLYVNDISKDKLDLLKLPSSRSLQQISETVLAQLLYTLPYIQVPTLQSDTLQLIECIC